MSQVKIAALKSELSRYLRRVQEGAEVVVTDRKIPIARIVPYRSEGRLVTHPAAASPRLLSRLEVPPARLGTDSLKALREEREDRWA